MEPTKKIKIIIVDDDKDDRELYHFLFDQNEFYQLHSCFESGLEALDEIVVKKNIPDILLIDMYMPFLTGVDVVREIIESDVANNMHKFIISTTINEEEKEKFKNHYNVTFLEKPVTFEQQNDLPGILLEALNYDNPMKI